MLITRCIGGARVSVRLCRLLLWLMGMTDRAAQSLFWCIIFNLGFAIEQSAEFHESSDHPLDLPVLAGPRGRVKKISNSQKHCIASMASKGRVFLFSCGCDQGYESGWEEVLG